MTDYSVFWTALVAESRELVAASKGDDNAFVGVCRARSVIEMDDEVTRLRALEAAGLQSWVERTTDGTNQPPAHVVVAGPLHPAVRRILQSEPD